MLAKERPDAFEEIRRRREKEPPPPPTRRAPFAPPMRRGELPGREDEEIDTDLPGRRPVPPLP